MLLTSLVVYALARRRHDVSRAAALTAALTSLLFNGLISMTGVDAIAILVIGAMLLALDRPAVFGALAIASIGINEKIPILFAAVLSARLALSVVRRRRFTLAPQLVLSGAAIAGYLALRMLWHVPGNEAQTNPALFVGHLRSTLAYSLSLKGAFLNLVPALVTGALALVAWHERRGTTFAIADGSGLVVLLLLAGLADVVYNVGRVAMYAYPLYLPAASAIVDDAKRGQGRRPRQAAERILRVPQSLRNTTEPQTSGSSITRSGLSLNA